MSPEHLCVQLAPGLTRLELVVLLSELMGIYAICLAEKGGMRQRRQPLMTPESLLAHLEALGTHRGVRQVREALHLACVMSGSPRETKLSLRLALPPALGGYGLNVLSMNEPVEVRRIRDRMQTGIRKPDILIGGPITEGRRVVAAVEYNGRVHDEPAQLASDADRTNELTRMGIPEFIVRREQYRDLDYMDGLAAGIRERLGLPEPRPSSTRARELRRRRFELYRELELIDGVHWNGREREKYRGW